MAPGNDDEPPRLNDAGLWRRVAGSVRPLPRERDRPSPQPRLPETQPPEPRLPETGGDAPAKAPGPARPRAPGARAPAPPLDDFWTLSPQEPLGLTHGAAAGLDKRTLGRLRRGMLPIEGTIDLHGLTQAEAHRSLHHFLAASQERGRRCILVITGKGSHSEGVLRAAVPHWLNLPASRSLVLAFAYATPAHGGVGALYVLLKRRR
jgi:DNA-nicking Smr family endonuclease